MINQRLNRNERADHHQHGREDQGKPVERLDAALVLLLEDHEVHPRGEDEGGDVVREVAHHAEDVAELRDEPGHQRDQHNLHNTEDDVRRVGDEVLALRRGAPVALDHLVHGLHPERETTDDGDHHQNVDRHRDPGEVGQRLQNIALHTMS